MAETWPWEGRYLVACLLFIPLRPRPVPAIATSPEGRSPLGQGAVLAFRGQRARTLPHGAAQVLGGRPDPRSQRVHVLVRAAQEGDSQGCSGPVTAPVPT